MFTKLWSKYSIILIELLMGIGLAAVAILLLFLTTLTKGISTDAQFKQSLNTFHKERHCEQKIILCEPDRLSETFELQVASEVKRVCSDVYPDLDSDYILAMIYHESRFQQDAVNSRTGATGLMQILPKWHTTRAENLGVSLNDWKGNILTGCDILNEILQQKGSMRYAINFYAGGYGYADYYEQHEEQSAYEKSLNNILSSGILNEMGVM